jgi:fused signal recognition particle receptor
MGLFDIFKSKDKREKANKYRIGMEKTRKGAFSRLSNLFSSHNAITDDFFDELEEIFVMADMGVDTVVKFIY